MMVEMETAFQQVFPVALLLVEMVADLHLVTNLMEADILDVVEMAEAAQLHPEKMVAQIISVRFKLAQMQILLIFGAPLVVVPALDAMVMDTGQLHQRLVLIALTGAIVSSQMVEMA
jgi:hypothetical protein